MTCKLLKRQSPLPFNTGLDRSNELGQRQTTGLAISHDLKTWQRYENNPILECDTSFYKEALT